MNENPNDHWEHDKSSGHQQNQNDQHNECNPNKDENTSLTNNSIQENELNFSNEIDKITDFDTDHNQKPCSKAPWKTYNNQEGNLNDQENQTQFPIQK